MTEKCELKVFDSKKIGLKIRSIRRSKNITQKQLGENLPDKVTAQQIQKYESGANILSIERLGQIANTLEVSIYEILGNFECKNNQENKIDNIDSFRDTKNFRYMAEFYSCIEKIDSIALKDKIIDVVKALS